VIDVCRQWLAACDQLILRHQIREQIGTLPGAERSGGRWRHRLDFREQYVGRSPGPCQSELRPLSAAWNSPSSRLRPWRDAQCSLYIEAPALSCAVVNVGAVSDCDLTGAAASQPIVEDAIATAAIRGPIALHHRAF